MESDENPGLAPCCYTALIDTVVLLIVASSGYGGPDLARQLDTQLQIALACLHCAPQGARPEYKHIPNDCSTVLGSFSIDFLHIIIVIG